MSDNLMRSLDSLGIQDEIEFITNDFFAPEILNLGKFNRNEEYSELQKWNDSLEKYKITKANLHLGFNMDSEEKPGVKSPNKTFTEVQFNLSLKIKYHIELTRGMGVNFFLNKYSNGLGNSFGIVDFNKGEFNPGDFPENTTKYIMNSGKITQIIRNLVESQFPDIVN